MTARISGGPSSLSPTSSTESSLAARYPLLDLGNVPAYFGVMAVWLLVSGVGSVLLVKVSGRSISTPAGFVWTAGTVFAGMMIMFGASALNLRLLRAGFARLAAGNAEPSIPRVWCPVLTMATRASVELATTSRAGHSELDVLGPSGPASPEGGPRTA